MFLGFLFIAIMAILARQSGGGFGAQYLNREFEILKFKFNLTWLPELLFAIPFGYVGMIATEKALGIEFSFLTFIFWTTWSYGSMQAGHWAVLGWDTIHKDEYTDRKRPTIEPIVNFIAKKLKIEKFNNPDLNPNYSRLFMGVKGFLIGLPCGGIPLAILWPLGYEIGYQTKKRGILNGTYAHALAEISTGIGAGIAILLAYYGT